MALDDLFVRQGGDALDLRRVVQQDAQVADPADAGVEAGRSLAGLETRVAEDALLRLARNASCR